MSARLAPYMEMGPLYAAMNFTLKYSDPTNTTVSYIQIKYLICPSEMNFTPPSRFEALRVSRITAGTSATGTSSAAAGPSRTR